jgi:ATP-binding cassette, subfamily B, bacterial
MRAAPRRRSPIDRARGGQILLDGVAAGAMPVDCHRRRVLLVPHAVEVFSASVRDNVRLWDPGLTDADVSAALARAQLAETVAAFPDGLNTILGARGNPLSDGQRQRLNLARIFLRSPDILILDEATSALDIETEQEVLAQVRDFMRGRVLIVITHREHVAARFDRIVRMDRGRVAAAGT